MIKSEKLEVSLVLINEIGADFEDQKPALEAQLAGANEALSALISSSKNYEDIVRQAIRANESVPEAHKALTDILEQFKKTSGFMLKAAEARVHESRARLDMLSQVMTYLQNRRTATQELYTSAKNSSKRSTGKRS